MLRTRLLDEPGIAFPLRFITRPARQDDVAWENRSVGHNQFEKLWQDRGISIRWMKPLGASDEHYGFEARQEQILVLGGNDALFLHRHTVRELEPMLDRMSVVYVWCPLEVRLARLASRNPALNDRPAELQARLTLDARHVLPAGAQIIDTRDGMSERLVEDVVERILRPATRNLDKG
jgi:ribose 1,5-bisphosphokinase PhnN